MCIGTKLGINDFVFFNAIFMMPKRVPNQIVVQKRKFTKLVNASGTGRRPQVFAHTNEMCPKYDKTIAKPKSDDRKICVLIQSVKLCICDSRIRSLKGI